MDPSRDVRAAYDALAETYLDGGDPPPRERALLEAFAAALPAGSRVLDAGCGAGVPAMRRLAADTRVVGLDAAWAQLDQARANVPAARPVRGDLTSLPFRSGTFEGVVSLHAVSHVPRDDRATVLREFGRVLGPGGRVLVTLGAAAGEGEDAARLETGERMAPSCHGRERSLALVREAGFTVAHDEVLEDGLGGSGILVVRADAA